MCNIGDAREQTMLLRSEKKSRAGNLAISFTHVPSPIMGASSKRHWP
jgi:hypothetical protein